MTFQFVRAGERRVNPIHKLGLKPVAVGQQEPTVNHWTTPPPETAPRKRLGPVRVPISHQLCSVVVFTYLLLRLGCISIVIIYYICILIRVWYYIQFFFFILPIRYSQELWYYFGQDYTVHTYAYSSISCGRVT